MLRKIDCSCATAGVGAYLCIATLFMVELSVAVQAQNDPFKNSPTGKLTISITVEGQSRHTAPNKVEWRELSVARRLMIELPMVRVATAPTGFRTSPKFKAAFEEMSQPSASVEEMGKAGEACKGDLQCMIQAGMKLGRAMQQGRSDRPRANPLGNLERFHHWMVDRRHACASGSVVIDDKGHGVSISPPAPAKPFSYRRTGERKLPADLDAVIEQACAATLAIDTADHTLDIAVSGPFIPVKVAYTGPFASDSGRSVPFVEGARHGHQVGTIDLLNFPVDPADKSMSGERQVERIGQVTHAGGYGVTPVRATVKWTFVKN